MSIIEPKYEIIINSNKNLNVKNLLGLARLLSISEPYPEHWITEREISQGQNRIGVHQTQKW